MLGFFFQRDKSRFREKEYHTLNTMFTPEVKRKNKEISSTQKPSGHLTDPDGYYACPLLFGSVNLDLSTLGLCCHAHHIGRGSVRIGKFHGNTFPMKLLRAGREKIIRDLNAGIDTPCTGCDLLSKAQWTPPPYPINNITINDWYICNLKCEYCYTRDVKRWHKLIGNKRTHDVYLLFKDIVKNKYLNPGGIVTWGGGEVTVYKGFSPTARLLMDYGATQAVNTNAVLYSKFIEEGLATHKMEVQVSVDAGSRKSYREVKGLDAYHRVCENISKYSQAGDLMLKYIIYRKNSTEADIEGFIELCRNSKPSAVILCPESNEQNQKQVSQNTLQAVARIAGELKKMDLQVNLQSFSDENRRLLDGML